LVGPQGGDSPSVAGDLLHTRFYFIGWSKWGECGGIGYGFMGAELAAAERADDPAQASGDWYELDTLALLVKMEPRGGRLGEEAMVVSAFV
jgi:hypothetical protein